MFDHRRVIKIGISPIVLGFFGSAANLTEEICLHVIHKRIQKVVVWVLLIQLRHWVPVAKQQAATASCQMSSSRIILPRDFWPVFPHQDSLERKISSLDGI